MVPLDCKILKGTANLDMSSLTGESMPVNVTAIVIKVSSSKFSLKIFLIPSIISSYPDKSTTIK